MTITFDRFIRWMLGALLAAAIIYMVNYLSNVLLPFFIAWLLAYLLYPTVRFVQYRMHVPGRVLSIIVTLVFVTVVIGCIVWMIIPPMIEQFERLGYLLGRYLHDTIHVNNFPAAIQLWLRENDETITSLFRNEDIMEAVKETMPKVFAVIGKTANIIMSIIASLITLLYMFFILKDYEKLSAGFIRLFPPKNRPFWRELTDDVERELDSYIRGQSLVALCIGVLCCIGFTVIGFPMAIGLGIMIGLMSLIPYVHSLALIPIVFLSALKAAGYGAELLGGTRIGPRCICHRTGNHRHGSRSQNNGQGYGTESCRAAAVTVGMGLAARFSRTYHSSATDHAHNRILSAICYKRGATCTKRHNRHLIRYI